MDNSNSSSMPSSSPFKASTVPPKRAREQQTDDSGGSQEFTPEIIRRRLVPSLKDKKQSDIALVKPAENQHERNDEHSKTSTSGHDDEPTSDLFTAVSMGISQKLFHAKGEEENMSTEDEDDTHNSEQEDCHSHDSDPLQCHETLLPYGRGHSARQQQDRKSMTFFEVARAKSEKVSSSTRAARNWNFLPIPAKKTIMRANSTKDVVEKSASGRSMFGRPPSVPDSTSPAGRTRGRPRPTLPISARANVTKEKDDFIAPAAQRRPSARPYPQEVSQQSASAATSPISSSAQSLAYSWDSLKLGKELGTAALNDYMRRIGVLKPDEDDRGALTAHQTLQIITSLRTKTCVPPAESDLHNVVQKTRDENRKELYGEDDYDLEHWEKESMNNDRADGTYSDRYTNTKNSDDVPIPFRTLARIYENMCTQDANDGSSLVRRETRFLPANAIVDRLRQLENRSCELKIRHGTVMKRGEELGIIDATREDTRHILGFRSPDEDETSERRK